MAGGVAGAVSRTVVSPLERLKILYQVQSVGRSEYQMSIYNALKKMWTEEGWRGFMRGNGTNCVRIIPYSAVQFGSYNVYKRVRESSKYWPLVLILASLQNPHQVLTCRRYGGWFAVAAQALPL
jgi:solute carrier family 25 (mitochondrial phosphate transporter), member 23/24/25/41